MEKFEHCTNNTWFANTETLKLNANRLSGTFPAALGNLISLEILDLGDNSFTGNVPPVIGNFLLMTELVLGGVIDGNQFSGLIPADVITLQGLQLLDLGPNAFTGSIPTEFGTLVNLRFLDLGNTFIAGPIPAQLGNLGNLTDLSLKQTGVEGPIPMDLGRILTLQTLDLSLTNFLTGAMPLEVCALRNRSLAVLRVGCNVACSCCTDYVCQRRLRGCDSSVS